MLYGRSHNCKALRQETDKPGVYRLSRALRLPVRGGRQVKVIGVLAVAIERKVLSLLLPPPRIDQVPSACINALYAGRIKRLPMR